MTHFNKFLIRIITSIILVSTLLLLAGCNQRNTSAVTTTQYESYLEDEDATEKVWNDTDDWEEDDTTTSTTVKKTESVKKDWKQAYSDFVYELEDSYKGYAISYSPCPDFSGDEIDDFFCCIFKDQEFVKEIACVYYNGEVVTFSSSKPVGFQGVSYSDKYLFVSLDEAESSSHNEGDVKYYKFVDGEFVFEKIDNGLKGNIGEYWRINPYGKYEMLLEIEKGNDHGFIY